jgi:hypothetical protein
MQRFWRSQQSTATEDARKSREAKTGRDAETFTQKCTNIPRKNHEKFAKNEKISLIWYHYLVL